MKVGLNSYVSGIKSYMLGWRWELVWRSLAGEIYTGTCSLGISLCHAKRKFATMNQSAIGEKGLDFT